MRKGQISLEYLIITGVILLAFIVPAAIFLSSFTRTSLNGGIQNQQANEVGEVLTETAKQTYYLGLYAKRRVTVTIPKNVERMYVFKITTADTPPKVEYNLAMIIGEGASKQTFLFQSVAPLVFSPPDTTPQTDISDCASPNTCTFSSFPQSSLGSGKREFEFETIRTTGTPSEVVVQIKLADS